MRRKSQRPAIGRTGGNGAAGFLLRDPRLQHLLRGIGMRAAAVCFERERRVDGDRDIAWKLADESNVLAELLDQRRVRAISGETESWRGHRVQAVGVDDGLALRALAGAPRPGRGSRRVAGNQVRGNGEVSQSHDFAVGDGTHVPHRWKAVGLAPEAVLRIVRCRLAAFDGALPGGAGRHRRPGEPLQRRDAAGVIVVGVRVQDHVHVRRLESQRANVRVDD